MQGIDFHQLFEGLSSPYMVLDRALVFVAVNGAYERSVMRRRDELLGKRLFDMFPNTEVSGERLRASLLRVLNTGESDTLAYLSYDIPRPAELGGGFEQRYWTAVHTPLTSEPGKVAYVVQNTVDVTDFVRLREAASLPFRTYSGEIQLIERAREAEDAHQALLAESADFRRMFQQAPGFIAVLSGPRHVFTFANDAYRRLVGDRDVIGKAVDQALPELEGQGFGELLDRVYETGARHLGEGTRVMLRREAGEEPRETFLDFSYDAIRNAEGQITGIFVQGMDRTEAVRSLRRQHLLIDEVNHRVKNTLATVQSIAAQTLRFAPDVATAKVAFESRIQALSKAHNILSARQWDDADFSTIVSLELAAYGDRRVACKGPAVTVCPKASIALAMLLHELATNATKFGALSSPEGRVEVEWAIDTDEALTFDWLEICGPVVSVPPRQGFGMRMMERIVEGELSGSLVATFDPSGFRCRLTVPHEAYRKNDDAFAQF